MNPGYAQLLAAVTAGICTNIRSRPGDVSPWTSRCSRATATWTSSVGAARGTIPPRRGPPAGNAVFDDGLDVLAELMGVDLDERRCVVEFAYALHDLDLPGRPIASRNGRRDRPALAGCRRRNAGARAPPALGDGRDLDPRCRAEHGYVVEIQGEPNLRMKLDIWPHQDLSSMARTTSTASGWPSPRCRS